MPELADDLKELARLLVDQPDEVEVEVRAGPPNGPVSAEHTVRITSGALTVGDADEEIRVDVEPGGVRIAVYLDEAYPSRPVRVSEATARARTARARMAAQRCWAATPTPMRRSRCAAAASART